MKEYKIFRAGAIPKDINKNDMKWDRHSGLYYLTKKQFKHEIENYPDRKIIGYTYLKEVESDAKCDKLVITPDYKDVNYRKYKSIRPTNKFRSLRRVKGYAKLAKGDYVAVVGTPFILIAILILIGVMMAGMALYATWGRFNSKGDKPGLEFEPPHDIVEEDKREAVTETIEIPGYPNITLSESKKELQLINPEGNTVYFMYIILEGDTEIYRTKAILPGNSVMCDLYSKLDSGTHTLTLSVVTYDVDTQAGCNGADQDILVTIEK